MGDKSSDESKIAFIFVIIPFLVFIIPVLIAYGIWHGFRMARAVAKDVNDTLPV